MIGSVSVAQRYFKRSSLSHRWEIASKVAIIELLVNPERKYVWLERESLASPKDVASAKSLIEGLGIDDLTKLLLSGEVLCCQNTDKSIDESLAVFEQVANIAPGSAAAHVGMARCYVRRGNLERAQWELDYVLTGKPFHETFAYFEEAYLLRAHVIATETNFRSAQRFILLALDLNMSCKRGWEMSAKVHLNRKMYSEAATAFGKCWELGNRQDPEMGYNFAYCTL
jgi:tetratricopeptide (TPR) repeat protein